MRKPDKAGEKPSRNVVSVGVYFGRISLGCSAAHVGSQSSLHLEARQHAC